MSGVFLEKIHKGENINGEGRGDSRECGGPRQRIVDGGGEFPPLPRCGAFENLQDNPCFSSPRGTTF